MSCIKEILKIKGNKDVLVPEKKGILIEGGNEYKGFDYIITFNRMGFRCAYVAIPTNNDLSKKDRDFYEKEIECHGGITFFDEHSVVEDILGKNHCADKWLGFDAGHCYDLYDKEIAEKHFDLRETERRHMDEMTKIMKHEEYAEIRTFEYMEEQCKSIIDQLIGNNLGTNDEPYRKPLQL